MASALKDGMTLGGNLPDSLSPYLYHDHDDDYEYEEEEGHDNNDVLGSDTEKVVAELDTGKPTQKA